MISSTIDLHQLTVIEAKDELDKTMDRLPKATLELVVIHGFRHGQRLKSFVNRYQHPRISRKMKTLNPGQTIFILKL